MKREYILIWCLTWFFFLLDFKRLYTKAEESGNAYSKGCAHLRCENGSRCIKRRFSCRNPPCPGMLYCSKSRKESLKGPVSCDTVHCNRGHICIIRVRGCHWDGKCKQQVARCIPEQEYYEGAASCAGFECPSGKRCILRETYCDNPPCKLIKSCAKAEDVQIWFDECRSLNCTSEYECFLRRPENNCLDRWCTHTPDCILTVENELISKYCYGWICPRMQTCTVQILNSCKGFNCSIERSCRASRISSTKNNTYNNEIAKQSPARKTLVQIESELIRQELEKKANTQTNNSITGKKLTSAATSTWKQSTRRTTPNFLYRRHKTEILPTRQQITTTQSNLIAKPLELSTNDLHATLPYSRSWLNNNKPLTTDAINEDNIFDTTSEFSDSSNNSIFPTTLLADRKIKVTTLRDTNRLEVLKKIYIATDDTLLLPVVLEGINFVGQGYPIWIKNDPHLVSLKEKDKDDNVGWRYHVSQEPYRILLPPYEPVILIEDTRKEEFFSILTYAFDRPFNETVLISLPEITGDRITTEDSKIGNNPTTVDDKIGNYINGPTTVEIENFRTNHFDDSSGDYVNFPVMEKTNTVSPNVRDKELNYYDNYDWQPWFMIHDYLERNEPQSVDQEKFQSSVDDSQKKLQNKN
ncbi:uncharacterized protein [Linepithema humile]|uniref:uncharacterized protein isoform X2 n=1 Tax=Linepithema humile TaxID=83485 RepID=UPI00351E91F1